MFIKLLNNQFYGNLLDTGIVFIILCLVYFLLRLFLMRRLRSNKVRKKVSARLNYVFVLF